MCLPLPHAFISPRALRIDWDPLSFSRPGTSSLPFLSFSFAPLAFLAFPPFRFSLDHTVAIPAWTPNPFDPDNHHLDAQSPANEPVPS